MALNPGVTREQVQDNTGFPLIFDGDTGVTAPPTDQELVNLEPLLAVLGLQVVESVHVSLREFVSLGIVLSL